MLYIFLVDTGTMMTFDMNLAMESVSKLQTVISKACHISEDKQVLLISGGESLDPHARVGRYSAGTDTNPIYLFSKTTIEAATPPSPSMHHGSDVDLHGRVEGSLIMPPAYETVVSRTQLAVQFHEVDEDELRACINLVHDQHLQQQGWAAVVANLEDITVALQQRSDIFQSAYTEYLEKREQYLETLSQIGDSLHLQTKIPLLRCLPIAQSGEEEAASTSKKPDLVKIQDTISTCYTLFQWINSQDPNHSLQDMVERCLKAAEQFNEAVAETLKKEVCVATEAIGNSNMKEVKGLEDRLYGLDQIMCGARKIVEEQSDMAKGFVQNQSRATNLRDKSILPDLCASHKKQLVAMLNNHKKLRDIKKKCRMAKEELAVNLHTRLRWVMFVEKKICDVDGKLTIYHESLRRLHKQLDIMRQIEEAPKVYAQLVVEVVRRRMFSVQFMEWANSLAEETKHLHTEEVKRRQSFQQEIGKHFLQSLFQGFEDLPPSYATEAPSVFDKNLPEITSQDVEMLRRAVPELEDIFRVPNDIPVSARMSFQTVNAAVSFHGKPDQDLRGLSAASDIDILRDSEEHLFVHIDGSKMSLGEQVATCVPAEIIISPEIVSTVEKPDFPIPQSLSETLTQEMSSEVKGVDVQSHLCSDLMVQSPKKRSKDSSDLLQSSTSPRSTESDPLSSDRSVSRKPTRKKAVGKGPLTSDTSPEVETSQEFTTADFYFDESMPSSMIDSPPNKSAISEKVAASGSSNKTEIIVSLEKELETRRQAVHRLEVKLTSLRDLFKTDLSVLKENISNLKDVVRKDQSFVCENVVIIQNQITNVIEMFVKQINTTHEDVKQALNKNYTSEKETLTSSLATKQKTIREFKEQLEALKRELEAQKLVQISLESQSTLKIEDLKQQHKTITDELQRKHLLEQELELDKLREELNDDLVRHEETIQSLNGNLSNLGDKMAECSHEKETAIEMLNKQFQIEKEAITQILHENYKKQNDSEIEKLKQEFLEDQIKKISQSETEIRKNIAEEKEIIKQDLLAENEKFMITKIEDLEKNHEEKMLELSLRFSEDKQTSMKELQESLDKGHSDKMVELEKQIADEKVKARQKPEIETESKNEQTDDEIKNSRTDKELELLEERLENDYKTRLEKVLQEERDHHLLELCKLESQYQKAKDNSLSNLKTSMIAEKQVQFNEAVEQVGREKDKVIESLKASHEKIQNELECQKLSFEKVVNECTKSDDDIWTEKLQQKEKEFIIMKHKLEDELALSRQQVTQYQQQLMGVSEMKVSYTQEGATCSESDYKLPAFDLEKILKTKDTEISSLKGKIMEMSMTASSKMVDQDKVSITSCKVGDLVLLCLDEPHDQYIVFTVRTTLHFLHSDCLEILGLKTGPGETRKSWILAEISDKEYCQAKKPQNRFKVPIGTKFYRVKAIPWSHDPSSRASTSGKKAE